MLTLDHVQRYIDLGFVVHPCCPYDHHCTTPGKIPYSPFAAQHMPRWQSHQQFSVEKWQNWLDYNGEINIGFLCGSPSQLIAFDIDEQEGVKVLEHYSIPWRDGWRYETGRGFRILFRSRQRVVSRILAHGGHHIEVLGDGRQSVLPPSLHPGGKRYKWVDGYTPRNFEPPEFDAERLESDPAAAAGRPGTATAGTGNCLVTSDNESEDWARIIGNKIPEGGRNITMTKIAGHLLAPHATSAEEAMVWMNLLNAVMCDPPLPRSEVIALVKNISKSEATQVASGIREIKHIAAERGLSLDAARLVWENSS